MSTQPLPPLRLPAACDAAPPRDRLAVGGHDLDLLGQRVVCYQGFGSSLLHGRRLCRGRLDARALTLGAVASPASWCFACGGLYSHLLEGWQQRERHEGTPALAVVQLDRPVRQEPMRYLLAAVGHGICVDPPTSQGWVAVVAGQAARWLRALAPHVLRGHGVRLHLLEPDRQLAQTIAALWSPDSPAYRDPAAAITGARLLLA